MPTPTKSENELRLEYNAILALIRTWPLKWQKELVSSLKSPPDTPNENISEITT